MMSKKKAIEQKCADHEFAVFPYDNSVEIQIKEREQDPYDFPRNRVTMRSLAWLIFRPGYMLWSRSAT